MSAARRAAATSLLAGAAPAGRLRTCSSSSGSPTSRRSSACRARRCRERGRPVHVHCDRRHPASTSAATRRDGGGSRSRFTPRWSTTTSAWLRTRPADPRSARDRFCDVRADAAEGRGAGAACGRSTPRLQVRSRSAARRSSSPGSRIRCGGAARSPSTSPPANASTTRIASRVTAIGSTAQGHFAHGFSPTPLSFADQRDDRAAHRELRLLARRQGRSRSPARRGAVELGDAGVGGLPHRR